MKKSNSLFEKLAMYEVMDQQRIFGGATAGQCSTFGGTDLPDSSDNPAQSGFRADVSQSTLRDDSCDNPIKY